MDLKSNINKYPSNNIEEYYKYSNNEFPKSIIETDSRYSTRYETKEKSNSNIKKKVEFNKNVTVINIQSYKKENKQNIYKKNKCVLDDEFNGDNKMKCVNCNIIWTFIFDKLLTIILYE